MPQLDFNAHITNFSWFVLVFFLFYISLAKMWIPHIYGIFLYRFIIGQIFLNKTYQHRLRLEYYLNLYQMLESSLGYFTTQLVLNNFIKNLNFQSKVVFSTYFLERLNLEGYFELEFEFTDPETFELNPSLFLE